MSIGRAAANRRIRLRAASGSLRPVRRQQIPAPYQGLNTRDPYDRLGNAEAFKLDNFVADVGGLVVRPGSSLFNDLGGSLQAKRIYKWQRGSETKTLVSSLNGSTVRLCRGDNSSLTFDLSAYQPIFRGGMFGEKLCLCNGEISPVVWDGSDDGSNLNITTLSVSGVSGNSLVGMASYKSRSYFWQKDTLDFYYSNVGVLGLSLTKFSLSTIARLGGFIMSINSWTNDAGLGVDDYFVVTTSKGEVIVYQGSNPNDPNDWALVGVYRIGEPVSRDAFMELDGKIHVITKSDIEIIPDRFFRDPSRVQQSRISGSIRELARGPYANVDNWQIDFLPSKGWILVNAPTGNEESQTFIRAAGGWARWLDLDAMSWIDDGQNIYFLAGKKQGATNSEVWSLGGNGDFSGSTISADIGFDSRQSYMPLRTAGEKRISAYRPMIYLADGTVTLNTQLAFDYSNQYGPVNTYAQGGTYQMQWGDPWGSPWAQGGGSRDQWHIGYGTGQSVSLRLYGTTKLPFTWAHTDIEYVPGGMY